MPAYATAADMVKRFDVRTLGDLVSDNGVRVSATELTADGKMLAALEDASGEIDAALMHQQRYSAADLAALTGNALATLKRLTCKIAFGFLWERRAFHDDDDQREEAIDKGRQVLEKLRNGAYVLNTAAADAGLPSQRTPTISMIARQNLVVEAARRRFYPARRLPLP